MKTLALSLLCLFALAMPAVACDYAQPLVSSYYAAPVYAPQLFVPPPAVYAPQVYVPPQQFVVPQAYYAPTVPIQLGYSASLPLAVSAGYSSYGVSAYSAPVAFVAPERTRYRFEIYNRGRSFRRAILR